LAGSGQVILKENALNWRVSIITAWVCALAAAFTADAAETDQFMTWGIELKDSSGILNARYNQELDTFLDRVNHRTRPIKDPVELTSQFCWYMSKGVYGSRYRDYIRNRHEIDKFPEMTISSFEYFRRSVYRRPAFPYMLPMSRTIRIGDVYLGVDKIDHFLCYARRYFQRYQRFIAEGMTVAEAENRLVSWGFAQEQTLVGGVVDGIVSVADLEANYQGFLLARDLCGGANPYVTGEGGRWRRVREIDLRQYITPDFDESWAICSFSGARKKQVSGILREEYAAKRDLPEVRARFERYRAYLPSVSKQCLTEHYRKKGIDLSFDALLAQSKGPCPVSHARH